jgi:cytochrome c oxidase subunit I+III
VTGAGNGGATIEQLHVQWRPAPTWVGWLATVDHKKLGIRYIVTACAFFVLGGVESAIMRLQLARPAAQLLSPEAYNQLFTMHGTTMMFLFIQPMLSGFSFYLTPLMIGARELAFPRLNTFSYYVFLLAGVFLYASFLVGQAPNGGWFNYTPLTGPSFDPGRNIDFFALGLSFLGISTTAGAINSIVTILKLRAPGMSLSRMPLFLWSSLTTSLAVVLAMPALTVALGFLELERQWHFVFFDPARGGSPLLWQHLFWAFGHPWVYIVFLPATGMLSMIIPVFSRRPMVGHAYVAMATVATGCVGFMVWAHHMFATGMSERATDMFSAASMVVSIPSAVQIAAWLATMWYGRVVLSTPMLFAIGFIAQFTMGGITGVMTASVPFDTQATDTYFVVAHLHYVLAGGSLFALFAALYYWFPKMTGRMLGERLGRTSFWVMFAGFNLAFFPMHLAGLMGMPRRVYTYAPGMGLDLVNLLSTMGMFVFAAGMLITFWNLARARAAGEPAGDDPWAANSLEWVTTSPPPDYNFAHLPIVASRDPLWDGGVSAGPAYADGRLTAMSSVRRASFQRTIVLPDENAWTLAISLGLLAAFAGLLVRWNALAVTGTALSLASAARWMWPARGEAGARSSGGRSSGGRSSAWREVGWWGMVLVCVTEGALFAFLIAGYFFLGARNPAWPPANTAAPALPVPLAMTALLAMSSLTLFWGERQIANHRAPRLIAAIGVAILLGIAFLSLQAMEFRERLAQVAPRSDAYASVFFATTGFHGIHVTFGILLLGYAAVRSLRGHFGAHDYLGIRVTSLYWHFVGVVWLAILVVLYLSPQWQTRAV